MHIGIVYMYVGERISIACMCMYVHESLYNSIKGVTKQVWPANFKRFLDGNEKIFFIYLFMLYIYMHQPTGIIFSVCQWSGRLGFNPRLSCTKGSKKLFNGLLGH